MEGSNYTIFLFRTQESFHTYDVEGTNSMSQEIEVSHGVTALWLGHHMTGNCATPKKAVGTRFSSSNKNGF